MQTDIIFGILVLIVSVILHEVAHGYAANALGDPTARLAGRLTLNPFKHIDLMGTIILPAILVISNSPVLIGYAKPVPYNPYNLRGRFDEALVAGAGPATNVLFALIFGLALRFMVHGNAGLLAASPLASAFVTIVYINMLLALFNLVPLPFLDGSKVLSGILPGGIGRAYDRFRFGFERLGLFSNMIFLVILIYLFSPVFSQFLGFLFNLLTGIPV